MPCYGLYTTSEVAERKAREGEAQHGTSLFVVPAVINLEDGFAVVDEADRSTRYIYNIRAEPGQRLLKERSPQ